MGCVQAYEPEDLEILGPSKPKLTAKEKKEKKKKEKEKKEKKAREKAEKKAREKEEKELKKKKKKKKSKEPWENPVQGSLDDILKNLEKRNLDSKSGDTIADINEFTPAGKRLRRLRYELQKETQNTKRHEDRVKQKFTMKILKLEELHALEKLDDIQIRLNNSHRDKDQEQMLLDKKEQLKRSLELIRETMLLEERKKQRLKDYEKQYGEGTDDAVDLSTDTETGDSSTEVSADLLPVYQSYGRPEISVTNWR